MTLDVLLAWTLRVCVVLLQLDSVHGTVAPGCRPTTLRAKQFMLAILIVDHGPRSRAW